MVPDSIMRIDPAGGVHIHSGGKLALYIFEYLVYTLRISMSLLF